MTDKRSLSELSSLNEFLAEEGIADAVTAKAKARVQHAAMKLGGPFAAIANAIEAGATSIPEIKRAVIAARRKSVGRNCNLMVSIGLLTEKDMRFSLTDKCRQEMP